jgi:peptide/nickel transport system substrate-binding protein
MSIGRVAAAALAAVLATCALLFTACGDSDSGGATESLSLQVFAQPPNLDLTRPTSLIQPLTLLYNVYEPLVQAADNPGEEPKPALAESWDVSDDGRTYTFHLRRATFHDGTPVTADDVAYSFERNLGDKSENAFIAGAFAPVESVEAVDDRTVEVTLSRRSNQFLTTSAGIAGAAGVIVPEGTTSEELATNPVATGPFRVDRFVADDSLYLNRFGDYWGDKPEIRRVRFRFIANPNSAVNALEAGDIDGIVTLTALERAQQLEGNPDVQVVEAEGGPVWHFVMNVKQEPFTDPSVREAVAGAIDQDGFVEAVQFGFGKPVCGWLPTTYPAYEEHCPYAYDPERAEGLLQQAGASGASIEIKANPAVEQASRLVAAQLREVGLDASVVRRDDTGYFEEVLAGDFQATVIGYSEDGFFDIANCPPPYWNGYCNRQAARLTTEADTAPSADERNSLLTAANQALTEDVPSVELFEATLPMVLPAGLEGYKTFRAQGEFDLRDLRFE